MLEALISALAGFASSWLGVQWSDRKNRALTEAQKARDAASAREAHLRNLREELTFNRRLFWEADRYLKGGPPIAEVLDPAYATCQHLRFSAWDALSRAGVLADLAPADQSLFGEADSAGRKAAKDVHALTVEWRRTLSWQVWNQKQQDRGELVQGIPLDVTLHQVQKWMKDALIGALESTDRALERLKTLLPEDQQSPAS